MRQKNRLLFAGALVASASLALTGCGGPLGNTSDSPAEAAVGGCEVMSGKTVSLIVPFSPGGGYDTYARIVAPKLGEVLDAQVVVRNQPGAGGLLAIKNLIKGKGDGTEIAIMNGAGTAAAVLAGAEGADFSLDDLSYIGRIGEDNSLVVSAAGSQYQSWDDVVASDGFRFGSAGRGSSDYMVTSVLIEAFDLKNTTIVTGFQGKSEVELALLQGNVDGVAGTADSRRAGIASGEQTPLLGIAGERLQEAPDTPVFTEMELTEQQELLLNAQQDVSDLGRSLVGPAEMDPGTLECLRSALGTIAEDEELLMDAKDQNRPISYVPGKEVEEEIVGNLKELPDSYLELLKESF